MSYTKHTFFDIWRSKFAEIWQEFSELRISQTKINGQKKMIKKHYWFGQKVSIREIIQP